MVSVSGNGRLSRMIDCRMMVGVSNVNHPRHYFSNGIEAIDVIEAYGLNFHRGNAVKYILRAGKKDQQKDEEDLLKARWYLDRELERIKSKAR